MKQRRFTSRLALAVLAVCLGWLAPASGALANMQVAPLIIELGADPGESGSFRVRNASTKPIPVEVTVVRREVAADQTTTFIPADEEFVIFPPQVVIPPQATQNFRFQFLGADNAGVSRSYYFYATQLPVPLDKPEDPNAAFEARLSFLYEYGISVNLVPKGARPDLVVTSAKPTRMDDGAPGVALAIENRGNRFGRASEHSLRIESGGAVTEYDPQTLKEGLNNGMWLPGQRLEIKFPVSKAASGDIRATFDYIGD